MSVVDGIEHVAIAVADLEAALARFGALGFAEVHTEDVAGGMRSHVLRAGDAWLELLEATAPDSDLHRFLGRRGEGLHHVCLRVGSLDAAIATAEAAGCGLVSRDPIADDRGHRVFIHPATNSGVLMGMVEPYEAEGRRIVDPGWESYRRLTFSPAAGKKGEVVFVSGLNAIAEDGVLEAPGDVAGQAAAIYRKLGEILATAGAGPGDVVKTTDYILSRDGYQETAAVRRDFFGDEFPAAAGVVVAGLLGEGVLIEIEAVFVI